MNRYFYWPDKNIQSKPIYLPNNFIALLNEGSPKPSSWAQLTKAEKSILPTLIFCDSAGIKAPSEVLLAGLCGLRTRKAVRNALSRLEERGIISIHRDSYRFINLNLKNDNKNILMDGSIILWGHWQAVGIISLSAQSLYVALRSLMGKTHTVTDSIGIICQIAGISRRHYNVALSALEECELVSFWEGSKRQIIPRGSVQFSYREGYLESHMVQ